MSLNNLFPGSMVVLLAVVLGMGARVANAQNPAPHITDIHEFVSCLNSIMKTNQTVADAVRCVPPGSHYTVTMSGLSAQPACRKDGVDLPRVIFSSPGPSDGKRFRPSFTLCPNPDPFVISHEPFINHIEVGEDIDAISHDQKMGDVNSPPTGPNFMSISEFDTGDLGVVSTNNNNKGCQGCHGSATTTTPPPNGELLSLKIFPSDVFDGFQLAPCVLATNDPDVSTPTGGKCPSSSSSFISTTPKPLSAICDAIESSTALASDPKVNFTLEIQLCERLDGKIQGN